MPLYTFELRDGFRPVEDDAGVDPPSRDHALRYAYEIVRELMKGCEPQTRSWRLDVYEAERGRLFAMYEPRMRVFRYRN